MKKFDWLGYIGATLMLFGFACFLGAAGGMERDGRTFWEQMPYIIAGTVQLIAAWYCAHKWEQKKSRL